MRSLAWAIATAIGRRLEPRRMVFPNLTHQPREVCRTCHCRPHKETYR